MVLSAGVHGDLNGECWTLLGRDERRVVALVSVEGRVALVSVEEGEREERRGQPESAAVGACDFGVRVRYSVRAFVNMWIWYGMA